MVYYSWVLDSHRAVKLSFRTWRTEVQNKESCMRLIFHSESSQGTEIWVLFENSLSNKTVSAPLLTSNPLNVLSEAVYKHILPKPYTGQKHKQHCKDATGVKTHLLSSTLPGPREIMRMLQCWRFSFKPVPQFSCSWSISADMFVNTWSCCCGAGFHLSCSCLPQTLRRAGVHKVPGRGTVAPCPGGQRASRGPVWACAVSSGQGVLELQPPFGAGVVVLLSK